MDLLRLHTIMRDNNFHYFNGKTNNHTYNLYIVFSTLHATKGDTVEIEIGSISNSVILTINNIKYSLKNSSEYNCFTFIEKILNMKL